MVQKINYPNPEKIIEYNMLALNILKVKKADKPEVLSYARIKEVIEDCTEKKGDLYDKAVVLLKGIIQKHPFASGNRRTAFIVAKDFLLSNSENLRLKMILNTRKLCKAYARDTTAMRKLRSGWKMAKSGNSEDEIRYKIVVEELEKFDELIKGHRKLLLAIGRL